MELHLKFSFPVFFEFFPFLWDLCLAFDFVEILFTNF